jgi:hypothetical protein
MDLAGDVMPMMLIFSPQSSTRTESREMGKKYFCITAACLQLPDWANHLSEEIRGKLLERVWFHFRKAYTPDFSAVSVQWRAAIRCIFEDCGPLSTPGYPILSKEEMVGHCREIHGKDDETIANLRRIGAKQKRLTTITIHCR